MNDNVWMIIGYVMIGFVVLFIGIGLPCAIISEKKDYNKGMCPICGTKFRYFDTDSSGARGYCCDKCRYAIWVSYNFIDKNHDKE